MPFLLQSGSKQSQRFEIHQPRSLVGATTHWLRNQFSRGE
jgi:hypothetical protein